MPNEKCQMTGALHPPTGTTPRFSFGIWHFTFGILFLLLPTPANAHPVPRNELDRNVTVNWRADQVQVVYRLELDEYTLVTTVNPDKGFPLDPKKGLGRQNLADAYIARMKTIIA